MRLILLTKNQHAIVDDSDYEWLMQWKWCAVWKSSTQSFYAARGERTGPRKLNKTLRIYMHRQILGLERGDKREGDHVNHCTLDNRRSKLRVVTHQQNHFNPKVAKGYTWSERAGKYMAQIVVNGRRKYLGLFITTSEAHHAYLEAKNELHGTEFC